ncbi:monovalent cation/H(+) antiporter subunit G [Chelativorans sp. YIM 93263]|uniref:monovalent cation/H(+) antiporter subunit G n=1 Tax=Chelativorans sp. YIM 93263 TaxID=2906648 RepID=UPI00237893D1|nr:monovalent cation/H(+) antiporter subunit G [Chelativorans sp. YIM 93263]
MIELLQNIAVGVLLLIGSGFTFIATVGLLRLPDLYSRMHSASKVGTVGSGCILIALALFSAETAIVTRALAAIVFLILTAPVSAHLLAKAAYVAGYRMWGGSVHDDMVDTIRNEDNGELK